MCGESLIFRYYKYRHPKPKRQTGGGIVFLGGGRLLPEFIDVEADAEGVGLSRGEWGVVEIVVGLVAQEVVDGKSD